MAGRLRRLGLRGRPKPHHPDGVLLPDQRLRAPERERLPDRREPPDRLRRLPPPLLRLREELARPVFVRPRLLRRPARLRLLLPLSLSPRCSLVRPSLLRRLLTVAAAICLARRVDRPRFAADSLMCSYCRSSLSLHALGIAVLLLPTIRLLSSSIAPAVHQMCMAARKSDEVLSERATLRRGARPHPQRFQRPGHIDVQPSPVR